MSALTRLAEKVEAGTATEYDFLTWREGLSGTRKESAIMLKAYHGSLDAAKALHDAVLPGWEWHLGPSNAKVYPYNGSPLKSWSGMADNPARAWLLAILRALAAGETP